MLAIPLSQTSRSSVRTSVSDGCKQQCHGPNVYGARARLLDRDPYVRPQETCQRQRGGGAGAAARAAPYKPAPTSPCVEVLHSMRLWSMCGPAGMLYGSPTDQARIGWASFKTTSLSHWQHIRVAHAHHGALISGLCCNRCRRDYIYS
jgi:hypothetical protein